MALLQKQSHRHLIIKICERTKTICWFTITICRLTVPGYKRQAAQLPFPKGF